MARKTSITPPIEMYLDDGRDRRFWRGWCRGGSRYVQTGETGTSGRTAAHGFDSPKAAASRLQEMAATRRDEGFREVDLSTLPLFRRRGRRAATDAQIARLQNAVGYDLPPDYVAFLKSANGGLLNPGYIEVPDPPYGMGVWGASELPGLHGDATDRESLWYWLKHVRPLLPDGVLPIGGDGDTFGIWLGQPNAVYKFDHEAPSGEETETGECLWTWDDAVVVAQSFREFLGRIAAYATNPDAYAPSLDDSWVRWTGEIPAVTPPK